MQTNTKEVYFNGYCDTCKYKNVKSTSNPCNECLSNPFNIDTHEPVMYEAKNPVTMIDKLVQKTLEKGMNIFPIIDDKKQSTRTVYSSKKTENRISEEIERMNPLTIEELRETTKNSTKEAIEEVDKNRKDLISVLDGSIENLQNEEITKIGDYAFYNNKNIKSVNCPNLKEIGSNAFYGCANLSEANLDKVEILYEGAFYLSSLNEVDLPSIKEFKLNPNRMPYQSGNSYFGNISKISMRNLEKISNEYVQSKEGNGVYLNYTSYIPALTEVNLDSLVSINHSALFGSYLRGNDFVVNVPKLEEITDCYVKMIYGNNSHLSLVSNKDIELPKLKRITMVKERCADNVRPIQIANTSTPKEVMNFPELIEVSFYEDDTNVIGYICLDNVYAKEINMPKLTSKLGDCFFASTVTKISAPLVTGFINAGTGNTVLSPTRACINLEEADFSAITSFEGGGIFEKNVNLTKLILNSLEKWRGSILTGSAGSTRKPITLILNKCKSVEMGAHQPKYEVMDLGSVEIINGAGYANSGIGDLIIRTDKVCELLNSFSSGSPEHIYVPKKYLTSDGYLNENSLWYTYKDNFVALEGSKYENVNWYKN